jgi:hypothetical protein
LEPQPAAAEAVSKELSPTDETRGRARRACLCYPTPVARRDGPAFPSATTSPTGVRTDASRPACTTPSLAVGQFISDRLTLALPGPNPLVYGSRLPRPGWRCHSRCLRATTRASSPYPVPSVRSKLGVVHPAPAGAGIFDESLASHGAGEAWSARSRPLRPPLRGRWTRALPLRQRQAVSVFGRHRHGLLKATSLKQAPKSACARTRATAPPRSGSLKRGR